jgi:hypothetical protein
MNRNLTFAISLAAGLLGGVLSHFVTLPSVHAQAPAANPVEVRAQRFTLVDDQGTAVGTFAVRESGAVVQRGPGYPTRSGNTLPPNTPAPVIAPRIVLLNPEGREIWSAGGTPFRTLAEK